MVSSAAVTGTGPASANIGKKTDKEAIHSGHFMVSDFEAEAQDDEENVLLEIPDEGIPVSSGGNTCQDLVPIAAGQSSSSMRKKYDAFDTSLTKLFNAMSIAYKHKITSPKWNRFKGLKLRWKDKIRLNNVIWRCWHMQFVRRKKMTVCQFALEVGNSHDKQEICGLPQAVVLEGKYWKRQLEAVTAEYKKWRIYYKNKATGKELIPSDESYLDASDMDWMRTFGGTNYSLEDGDISELMDFNDVLFSSLFSQPQGFAFPNPREIARGTDNSTFMQPGLIQLQPNLDDFMDIVEPLQEMLAGHRGGLPLLPTVPEEDLFPEVATPQPSQMSPLPAPPAPSSQTPTTPTLNNSCHFTARVTTQPYNTHHQQQQPSASSPNHASPTPPLVSHNSPLSNHSSPQHKPMLSTIDHHSLYATPQLTNIQPRPAPQQAPHHSNSSHMGSPSPPGSYRSSPILRPPTLQTPEFEHGNSLGASGQVSPVLPTSPGRHQQEGNSGRVFLRTHSQQDLKVEPHFQPQTPDQPGFVIPKQVPRRRSHSSGSSSGGSNGNIRVSQHTQQQQQQQQQQHQHHHVITTLPQLAPAPPHGLHQTTTHLPIQVMPTPVMSHQLMSTPVMSTPIISTPSGSSSSSQLLEHLLTTNNYASLNSHNNSGVIPNNSSSSSSSHNSSQPLKVSLVIPGVIPSPISSNAANNSSSSVVYSNPNTVISSSSSFVAPITLSAVTPSTLRNNNNFNQLSSIWNQGTSGSPRSIKSSPPHGEPHSPLNMHNVPSPQNKPFRPKNDHERVQYKEHRRVCHINAEQKRRSNLKNNFDIMHHLIPSLSQNPNSKVSKAAMLQKGADYIQQLKSERSNLSDQTEKLKHQIETLSSEISNAQALLPATGAPMTHARHSKLREMYNQYNRERTMANWKFYIFGLITEPLLESYNSSVSTGNLDDLCRSSLAWLDQQCSLNILRPLVSNSMRKLSTTTNILAEPESLPEEIYQRITKQEQGQDKFSAPR